VRSETLLSAGLKYLHDLQRHTLESVACANSHELMRTACLALLLLTTCGEDEPPLVEMMPISDFTLIDQSGNKRR